MMRKNKLGLLSLSLFAVSALLTSCGPNTHVSDWTKVEFTELPETVIGTNLEITAGKLDQYTEDNLLRIALVTDSGTLNDHSFNEASWKTLKTFEGTELAVDLLYEKLRGNVRYSYVDNCLKMIGNVPSSPKMDSIMNYYNRLKATQPLGKAPAFTLPNTEGKMISLSDYSGKYVLVNFWSSTCGPCRMKMRMWQREQERFKNAGVEILSISCDRQKEDWLKAIKQDQLSWEHLLEGKEMPVSQAYGMEYLSDSYLISPEGIILGKNLSLAEIEDTVRRTKN